MPLGDTLQLEHFELILQGEPAEPVILSQDGSGITYRAQDADSGKPVIIRLFSERLLSDSGAQQDFVKRARVLIELDHPDITRIIDTGQAGNRFFYVLEDPGGEIVRQLVETKPFDVALALQLHQRLLEVLIALRSQPGLLPRVWPGNLLVTLGAKPRVCILAQNLVDPAPPIEDPEFVAPEVLRGDAESPQSTLYSIGATLYHMLTGQAPYPRQQDLGALAERMARSAPDFSKLPPAAPVDLIRRLLSPDPRKRPASLFEWDRDLRDFLRQDTKSAVSETAPPASGERELQLTKQLEDTKAHTQRLSVELTKRVQKELEMSNRLKQLESELDRERLAAQSRGPTDRPEEIERLRREKERLAAEWQRLEQAQRALERDRQTFLERTQRVSIAGVHPSQATPTPGEEASAPGLVRLDERFFGPLPDQPTPTPEVADAEARVRTPEDGPQGTVTGPEAISPAPAETGSPRTDDDSVPAQDVEVVAADVMRFAKPEVLSSLPPSVRSPSRPAADGAVESRPEATKIPVGKATSAITDVAPHSPTRTTPVPPEDRKGKRAALVLSSGKPRPPEVVPTRCGWPTLVFCALLIGSTLYFMPFRTFFASGPALRDKASEFSQPVSVDVDVPVAVAGDDAESEPLNQDLWMETKVMENFRLIQNQEWAELLHGLKRLESTWGAKYPESVAKIREVMADDIQFTGELGTPEHVKANQAYQELLRYLEAADAFPPAPLPEEVDGRPDLQGTSSSNHSSSGSKAGIGTFRSFSPAPTAR